MEAILPAPASAAPAANTIALRPDLYETLLRIAAREGKQIETVADEMLTETLRHAPASHADNSTRTLAEITASVQADFEESGMTDDELCDFIEGEVAAYRSEQAAKGK